MLEWLNTVLVIKFAIDLFCSNDILYHNRCLATKRLIGMFNHKTTVWLHLLFLLLALTVFKVCSIHPASAFEVGQASLVESSAPQWFTKRLTQNVMVWDTEILFRRYVILQVLDLLERQSKEWVVDVGPPRKAFQVYHLESRWRNSHVLVYDSPLQSATFWWLRHLLFRSLDIADLGSWWQEIWKRVFGSCFRLWGGICRYAY